MPTNIQGEMSALTHREVYCTKRNGDFSIRTISTPAFCVQLPIHSNNAPDFLISSSRCWLMFFVTVLPTSLHTAALSPSRECRPFSRPVSVISLTTNWYFHEIRVNLQSVAIEWMNTSCTLWSDSDFDLILFELYIYIYMWMLPHISSKNTRA